MIAPSVTSPARRRGMTVAVLSLLLGTLASPALASAAVAAPAGTDRAGSTAPGATAPQVAVFQQRASTAYDEYEQSRELVSALSAQVARLDAHAVTATEVAGRLRDEVTTESGGTLGQVLAGLVGRGGSDLDRAAEAAVDAQHARELAASVRKALSDAIAETEGARLRWETARQEMSRVEQQWTARQAADAAIRRSRFRPAYDVADRDQDDRNRNALRAWHAYLEDLVEVGVVPPAAKRLENPDRLRGGLDRVRDARGGVVAGVAEVDPAGARPVTVLPAETIRAVSEAFSRLGLPRVPGAVAPSTYACGGLVANAWGTTSYAVPADSVGQWRTLRSVPRHSLHVGDAVVLGSRKTGLEQSGIYVGGNQMIVADPKTGIAGVQTVPRRSFFGAKRVPLPAGRSYDGPAAGPCGVEPVAPAPDVTQVAVKGRQPSLPLVLPVPAGSYTLSALFGDSGSLWSSGSHSGLDFAAPTGTSVVAAAGGVVTVESPGWAGNLVRIDHGGGVETWYAHLSDVHVTSGQTVKGGQLIGAVGNEGNSTGPHLHLEVRIDGLPVDPAAVFDVPERPRQAYANGQAPAGTLCAATEDGSQLLRCDAAVGYRLMSAAFAAQTGTEMCITDSYRSRDGQEQLFRTKPGLAAMPGTSVHGWGLAVDLCGGVERFGTSQHAWMVAHGPAYGWEHPAWAAAGSSRAEPWHFEYSA